MDYSQQDANALFISAYIDELISCGVKEIVISPGSRCAPLAMVAYASKLKVYIDIDERGAAFFALGLAKASSLPVGLICTSGTAAANYFPAIIEAKHSRVPLIVMTADRPARLQGVFAPQTCDQLHLYKNYVARFCNVASVSLDEQNISFIRSEARELYLYSKGNNCSICASPVHINFQFEEPLLANLGVFGLFELGRSADEYKSVVPRASLSAEQACSLYDMFKDKNTVIIAGEGTCKTAQDQEAIIKFAEHFKLPVFADCLSGLFPKNNDTVVLNPENSCNCDIECCIRFGANLISKQATRALNSPDIINIVVDPFASRDYLHSTAVFVQQEPASFADSMLSVQTNADFSGRQNAFANIALTAAAPEAIANSEGELIASIQKLAPENSLIFSANSMSVRLVDKYFKPSAKQLRIMANRSLNGIDGTNSTAFGAAVHYNFTTFITGDISFLHDINALAMQSEIIAQNPRCCIVAVLLNNCGGAIFNMLEQKSEDPYFSRLFTAAQDVSFAQICSGFGVNYALAEDNNHAKSLYEDFITKPGINVIEVRFDNENCTQRYLGVAVDEG